MGGSGSKSRGFWPFAGSGIGSDPANGGNEQTLSRLRGSRSCTPFVFTRRSSLYYDEDGDLAHEFYEETIVTKNGRKRAKLKKIQKNLIPQGMVKLDHPRIHVDFPVVLCEVWRRGVWKTTADALTTPPPPPPPPCSPSWTSILTTAPRGVRASWGPAGVLGALWRRLLCRASWKI